MPSLPGLPPEELAAAAADGLLDEDDEDGEVGTSEGADRHGEGRGEMVLGGGGVEGDEAEEVQLAVEGLMGMAAGVALMPQAHYSGGPVPVGPDPRVGVGYGMHAMQQQPHELVHQHGLLRHQHSAPAESTGCHHDGGGEGQGGLFGTSPRFSASMHDRLSAEATMADLLAGYGPDPQAAASLPMGLPQGPGQWASQRHSAPYRADALRTSGPGIPIPLAAAHASARQQQAEEWGEVSGGMRPGSLGNELRPGLCTAWHMRARGSESGAVGTAAAAAEQPQVRRRRGHRRSTQDG